MAIEKHKMGMLIAALKPKDEEDDSEESTDETSEGSLRDISDALFDAIKDDDKEAFYTAVKKLKSCSDEEESE